MLLLIVVFEISKAHSRNDVILFYCTRTLGHLVKKDNTGVNTRVNTGDKT